jgi:nucleotide-binding universal stress UspA family protein
MYRRILVAIENSASDRTILTHIEGLARITGSELLLVHVADGVVARHLDDLQLRESEEMKDDRAYLDRVCAELQARGFPTTSLLAAGDPVTELVRVAKEEHVDLIAMATHGHRFLSDLLHGTTADRLRHLVDVPVLLLKAHVEKKDQAPGPGPKAQV